MRKLSHITILDEYAVDTTLVLGQGSTGCVYQGLNMKSSSKVAVKIIDLRTINNEVAEYLLQMEKTALMILNSPYVLKGLKVAQDARYCFLVTEFCNGGTLKKFIQASPGGFLTEETALKIVSQILKGEKSLIEKGVVHRDLKPANIMLHQETAKIIDFGYCSIQGYPRPSLEYNVGSPSYMAPESFELNVYNEKTEIWAIGVILYECVTGKTIDEGRYMAEVYQQIKTQGIPYPSHVSYHVRTIINWCLTSNPKNRPTCSQLIQSYFGQKTSSKIQQSSHRGQNAGQSKKQQIYSYRIPESYLKDGSHKINHMMASDKEGHLFKSTRVENKSKSYRLPTFLQASTKLVCKNVDEKKNKPEKGTPNQFHQNRRVLPSKSGKIYPNQLERKENYEYFFSSSGWEYGASVAKSKTLISKKILEGMGIQKPGKTESIKKERINSIQISVSPYRPLKKSPSRFESNLSKEARSRMKRTLTDRGSMIRA